METRYGKGFDVIMNDIIDKVSDRPTKVKKYITKFGIVFRGSNCIETINVLYKFYLKEINELFDGVIRGVVIDCLKRTVRCKRYKL